MTAIAVRPTSAIKREHVKNQQFASLDGLRGLAIVLVLWCHTDAALNASRQTWSLEHVLAGAAWSGVVLFFVLSGFLLFLPYARAIIHGDFWPSTSRFYLRRALRILPSYYALLPLFLIFMSLFHNGNALGEVKPIQALLGVTLLYDLRIDTYNLVTQFDGPLWSLTLEWQFYLLLPWLALALAGLTRLLRKRASTYNSWPWGLLIGVGSLVVIGLAIRAFAASSHYAWGYPAGAPDQHMWLNALLAVFYGVRGKYLEVFALGILASVVYVAGVEQRRLSPQLQVRLGKLLCSISLLGLVACIPWQIQAHRLYGWGGWSNNFPPQSAWLWGVAGDEVLGLCYACLLLGVLLAPKVRQAFSLLPLRFLGHISYSLYLWHVLWFALFLNYGRLQSPPGVVLLLIIVLLWSLMAYVLIERPFLRLQRRFRTDFIVSRADNGRQG